MKKNKTVDHISLRHVLAYHYRGFKLWHKGNPQLFAACGIKSVVGAITPYVGIYLSAQIINELGGNRDAQVLWRLVIITLVSTAALAMLNAGLLRWKNCIYAGRYHQEDELYTAKMLDMDFASLDEQRTADLRSQIRQNRNWGGWGMGRIITFFESGISAVVSIISASALTVSLFLTKVPDSAGTLTVLNSPLAGAALIAVLLMATFIAPLIANKADSYWVLFAEGAKQGNRFFGFFGFMGGDNTRALDVRIYQQEKVCHHYADKDNAFKPGSQIAKYAKGPMGLLAALSKTISAALTGLVYVFVCVKAWTGAFGIGAITQYVGAITALSQGVAALIETIGEMRSNTAFLEPAYTFLDIPNNMYQGSLTTEKRADRNYEVEFRNVSFKYPGQNTYALRHVSMKFQVGQRLAVVGMNGSGKTTFIKLLCRLYDPTEGEILLNGINIRKYQYNEYIAIFSVVFQDFQLLSLPLGENVAAAQTYDRSAVLDSLDKAGFHDRLAQMPKGLDTNLYKEFDKQGVEVSGGEGQKIALARTLYKDAPFIILDEPTAALDPIAEAEIYTKFNEIVGDKTAIYISHRLSSCRFCDAIAVFHEGSVIQQGTHDALVADKTGKYYALWHAQAQYYEVRQGDVSPA